MCGAAAGEAVGDDEYALCDAAGGGEHEPGEGVHSDGNAAQGCGHHGEESGLGGHGVDHDGALAAYEAYESAEADDVAQG